MKNESLREVQTLLSFRVASVNDVKIVSYLEESPKLSRLLQLRASFNCQLFQLLQTGGDVVDTVTDHLRVTWLVTWETTKMRSMKHRYRTSFITVVNSELDS